MNHERNIIYKFIYKKSPVDLEYPCSFYVDERDNIRNFENLPSKDSSMMMTK